VPDPLILPRQQSEVNRTNDEAEVANRDVVEACRDEKMNGDPGTIISDELVRDPD
jgi:hypothetical protein